MRGRRKPKTKVPRAPRRKKETGEGRRKVALNGRPYYVITEGPDQSVLYSVDDMEPREVIACNTWFKSWREKIVAKEERVRLKRRFRPGREMTEMRAPRFDTLEDEL